VVESEKDGAPEGEHDADTHVQSVARQGGPSTSMTAGSGSRHRPATQRLPSSTPAPNVGPPSDLMHQSQPPRICVTQER
jgi:hypothetical protein